jgi:hypothetical protein
MQGIVRIEGVRPAAVEILSRVWVVGVIPFFVGIGLLVSSLFFRSPRELAAKTGALEPGDQFESLQSAPTDVPSQISVTEDTTRHLKGLEPGH